MSGDGKTVKNSRQVQRGCIIYENDYAKPQVATALLVFPAMTAALTR